MARKGNPLSAIQRPERDPAPRLWPFPPCPRPALPPPSLPEPRPRALPTELCRLLWPPLPAPLCRRGVPIGLWRPGRLLLPLPLRLPALPAEPWRLPDWLLPLPLRPSVLATELSRLDPSPKNWPPGVSLRLRGPGRCEPREPPIAAPRPPGPGLALVSGRALGALEEGAGERLRSPAAPSSNCKAPEPRGSGSCTSPRAGLLSRSQISGPLRAGNPAREDSLDDASDALLEAASA